MTRRNAVGMPVASAPATDRMETGVFLFIGIGFITTWWDPWCGRKGDLSARLIGLLAPWNGPLTGPLAPKAPTTVRPLGCWCAGGS